nr:LuxR C-terminal-related transcriptional regulator [Oscillochloris sp. ZM17-4]
MTPRNPCSSASLLWAIRSFGWNCSRAAERPIVAIGYSLLTCAAPGPQPFALSPSPLEEPLSAQELLVLRLLAEGCSNQAIAERLVITVGTAKWHAHNIYAKLGVSRRTQAVARARALGLIT